jgi:kynureninase
MLCCADVGIFSGVESMSQLINDAIRHAVARAAHEETIVYLDGPRAIVKPANEPAPENGAVYCIAQRWNQNTVQLRFEGAKSEWVQV